MDVTENGLRSAVKSLTDIVSPAVNPKDPLANEQLKLVIDYLEFVRSRIDYLCFRETFELRANLKIAEAFHHCGAPISDQNRTILEASVSNAHKVLDAHELRGDVIRTVASEVAAIIREIVRESSGFDVTFRHKVEQIVLDMSAERINFERSWYLPLGFDPSPKEVPSLNIVISKIQDKNDTYF